MIGRFGTCAVALVAALAGRMVWADGPAWSPGGTWPVWMTTAARAIPIVPSAPLERVNMLDGVFARNPQGGTIRDWVRDADGKVVDPWQTETRGWMVPSVPRFDLKSAITLGWKPQFSIGLGPSPYGYVETRRDMTSEQVAARMTEEARQRVLQEMDAAWRNRDERRRVSMNAWKADTRWSGMDIGSRLWEVNAERTELNPLNTPMLRWKRGDTSSKAAEGDSLFYTLRPVDGATMVYLRDKAWDLSTMPNGHYPEASAADARFVALVLSNASQVIWAKPAETTPSGKVPRKVVERFKTTVRY